MNAKEIQVLRRAVKITWGEFLKEPDRSKRKLLTETNTGLVIILERYTNTQIDYVTGQDLPTPGKTPDMQELPF